MTRNGKKVKKRWSLSDSRDADGDEIKKGKGRIKKNVKRNRRSPPSREKGGDSPGKRGKNEKVPQYLGSPFFTREASARREIRKKKTNAHADRQKTTPSKHTAAKGAKKGGGKRRRRCLTPEHVEAYD